MSCLGGWCLMGLWALVAPLIPKPRVRPQGGGRGWVDDRAVFTAIVFVLTSGCAWRHLPPSFGVSVPTAHRRFSEWTRAGLWARLHRPDRRAAGGRGLRGQLPRPGRAAAPGPGDPGGPLPARSPAPAPGQAARRQAYDSAQLRDWLRRRGITPRIARRGVESGEKLGRHRWVIERSIAWLLGYHRLTLRYERHAHLSAPSSPSPPRSPATRNSPNETRS
jgi:transposase